MEIGNFEEAKEYLYRNRENYTVEYPHKAGKECYIFFSSNGLYAENDFKKFKQNIWEDDRYEWQSITQSIKNQKTIGKIIYVRDIYKKFYIHGINFQIDDIDKLIDVLRSITDGYVVTTIGISSGGYLAVICAALLNAKRAFSFSGQFNIENHLQETDLLLCRQDAKREKYLDIMWLLKRYPHVPIYYFCPIGCEHDFLNYQMVKGQENVRSFLFQEKKHAATVYPFNFPDLLLKSNECLDALFHHYQGKAISKKQFFRKTVTVKGFFRLVRHTCKMKFRISILKEKWTV